MGEPAPRPWRTRLRRSPDRSGLAQVVFDAQSLPSASLLEAAKEIRSEFVLEVEGTVVARDASAVNADLPTGEVEVRATALAILNRADTPPFPIEDGVKASEDLRLRYRYSTSDGPR